MDNHLCRKRSKCSEKLSNRGVRVVNNSIPLRYIFFFHSFCCIQNTPSLEAIELLSTFSNTSRIRLKEKGRKEILGFSSRIHILMASIVP